jgi:hypothetical protein
MLEADLRRAILCEAGSDEYFLPRCDGTCMAHLLGWRGMYVKPLQDSRRRWRTPTRGDLAAGWPDLFLVHPKQQRVLFAELKSDSGHLRDEQVRMLELFATAGQEAYLWYPHDLDSGSIYRTLRGYP